MKKPYLKKTRISMRQFRKFSQLFAKDFTTLQIADLMQWSRNTANLWINRIRERILLILYDEKLTNADGRDVLYEDERIISGDQRSFIMRSIRCISSGQLAFLGLRLFLLARSAWFCAVVARYWALYLCRRSSPDMADLLRLSLRASSDTDSPVEFRIASSSRSIIDKWQNLWHDEDIGYSFLLVSIPTKYHGLPEIQNGRLADRLSILPLHFYF
jgi:hypothetical protein